MELAVVKISLLEHGARSDLDAGNQFVGALCSQWSRSDCLSIALALIFMQGPGCLSIALAVVEISLLEHGVRSDLPAKGQFV